jgi:hypothetical protein
LSQFVKVLQAFAIVYFDMSIYLEFPRIAEYPIYGSPFSNDEQQFFPSEDELKDAKEEKEALQDFLLLKTV